MIQKRNTAYKVWISDLINNEFIEQQGEFESNYVLIYDKKVSRVNLVASIIFVYKVPDESYVSISLDDSSCNIRIKSWREDTSLLKNLKVGEIINIIGKIRKYNNEVYIIPEVIKVLDNPNWELVRKLELVKEYGKPKPITVLTNEEEIITPAITEETVVIEEKIENVPFIKKAHGDSKQKVIEAIKKLDLENGAKFDDVIANSGLSIEETNDIIKKLLEEGEIYQPKPNYLKLID